MKTPRRMANANGETVPMGNEKDSRIFFIKQSIGLG
jgi:hypothetical protein